MSGPWLGDRVCCLLCPPANPRLIRGARGLRAHVGLIHSVRGLLVIPYFRVPARLRRLGLTPRLLGYLRRRDPATLLALLEYHGLIPPPITAGAKSSGRESIPSRRPGHDPPVGDGGP